MSKRPNIVQNYEADLNSLLDLYVAHDHLHPDKNECGGVGRCLMMRTEVQTEQQLEELLHKIAYLGRLRIEVTS